MEDKIFQNEFDAWQLAQSTTKLYFMITESSIGSPNIEKVYYLVVTQTELPSLCASLKSNNKLLRVYSRKTNYSFSDDITEVNNRLQFVGQC